MHGFLIFNDPVFSGDSGERAVFQKFLAVLMRQKPLVVGGQTAVLMLLGKCRVGSLGQADQAFKAFVAHLAGAVVKGRAVDFDRFAGI